MIAFCTLGILVAAIGLLLILSVQDWQYRRLPNRLVVLFAGLFPVFWLLSPVPPPFWQHAVTALVVFGAAFFCFMRGWMGGGDAKLLTAAGLWLGPKLLIVFLPAMALTGLLLAVCMSVNARGRQLQLPYGIAIALPAAGLLGWAFGAPLLDSMH